MKFQSFWFSIAVLAFASCNKPEGEGGKSSILGTVYHIDYVDEYSFVLDTFPAMDEDVFVVYGNGTLQNDDTKTNYEGRFSFNFLRAGDYQLFVYSRDVEQSELFEPIIIPVSLGKKEDKTVDDIYIYASRKGHSLVTGKVLLSDHGSDGLKKREFYSGDVEVYLSKKDGTVYLEKANTHHDGTYVFPYLRTGEYYVYAYSKKFVFVEGVGLDTQIDTVQIPFVIDSFGQSVVLEDLLVVD